MSTLKTGNITHPSSTGTAITLDASDNVNFNSNAVTGIASINGGQIGGSRNLVTNGSCVISQRGTSFSIGNNSATYTLDRWNAYERGDAAITVSQESDGPSGFIKSLKVLVTTADASLADPDRAYIEQKVEGQNSAFLDFGSSTAKTITISFWVKSNVTSSNHSFVLANGDDDRAYAVDYTVSSSDTWEFKTITIDGDTSGTWDTDNSAGMIIRFGLGVPTGGARAIAAGSWSSTSNVCGSTSAVNVLAAINNYIQITGVQLEVGSEATPFEHRSYGDELARCQRYYFAFINAGSGQDAWVTTASCYSTNNAYGGLRFPVTMRAIPTLKQYTGTNVWQFYNNNSSDTFNSFTMFGAPQSTVSSAMLYNAQTFAVTAGHSGNYQGNNSSCYLHFDAEL